MSDQLANTAILQQDDIPEEALLGNLVGIVHHKFTLPHEELDKIIKKAKLPEEYWPNKSGPTHAFEKACRMLENPKSFTVEFQDPGTGLLLKFTVEFMIDILSDGCRQLTRKIYYTTKQEPSPEMQKILNIYEATTQKEPEKMAKFDYDAGTETLRRVDLYDDPDVLDIGNMTDKAYERLIGYFDSLKGCYTERHLKHSWANMLRKETAIPWLKNCGSFWFVPKSANKCVEAFGEIYQTIHNSHGTWRVVPIVNTEQHREYLRQDVMVEYNDRYKAFLKKVADRMKDGWDEEKLRKWAEGQKKDFEGQMKSELIGQYNELLGMSISASLQDFSKVNMNFESSRLEKAREFLTGI